MGLTGRGLLLPARSYSYWQLVESSSGWIILGGCCIGIDCCTRRLTAVANLALAVLICVAATVRIRGGAIRAMCGRTAAPRAARAGSREKAAPRCYAYLLTSDSLLLS